MPVFHQLDIRILYALYGGGGPAVVTDLMIALSFISKASFMWGIGPLLGWIKSRRDGIALVIVLIACIGADYVMKSLVECERPCAYIPGIHSLYGNPTDNSFPSGHALRAFAFAGCLAMLPWAQTPAKGSWKRWLPTASFVFAGAVGWSRVYIGVHFPSDVVCGALVGVLVGAIGARITCFLLRKFRPLRG